MALTSEQSIAQQRLLDLQTSIDAAESNMRVLNAMGLDTVELHSKLSKAKADRDKLLAAIRQEDQRTG